VVDVNTRSFYTEKFRVMTSSVFECDTKNTDLSKLGSYRISDTTQYIYVWNVRIRFLELSNVCSSLDGIWTHTIVTLQHHSLSLTSSALDHSTTYTPHIYIFTISYIFYLKMLLLKMTKTLNFSCSFKNIFLTLKDLHNTFTLCIYIMHQTIAIKYIPYNR
jgi:hypothetical protein